MPKFRTISAIDDGNCAYGAASLGLTELTLKDILDNNAAQNKYDVFLKIFGEQLKLPATWAEFKNYLTRNLNDPIKIQEQIASVLRALISQLQKNKSNLESEITAFSAEFRDYVSNNLKLPLDEKFHGGDIFIKHSFIIKKFHEHFLNLCADLVEDPDFIDELQAAKNTLVKDPDYLSQAQINHLTEFEDKIKAQLTPLIDWFKEVGHQLFLIEMEGNARWAGDLELKEFGEYFEIDIIADEKKIIYSNHGTLPAKNFQDLEIKTLIARGIVEENTQDDLLRLKNLTEQELDQKISEVSEFDAVYEDWSSNPQHKKLLSNKFLSNISLMNALLDRGIINKNNEDQQFYYFTDLTFETLLSKLVSFDKADFKNAWLNAKVQKPYIMLSNPSAVHWYYLQPEESKWDLSQFDKFIQEEKFKSLFTLPKPETSATNELPPTSPFSDSFEFSDDINEIKPISDNTLSRPPSKSARKRLFYDDDNSGKNSTSSTIGGEDDPITKWMKNFLNPQNSNANLTGSFFVSSTTPFSNKKLKSEIPNQDLENFKKEFLKLYSWIIIHLRDQPQATAAISILNSIYDCVKYRLIDDTALKNYLATVDVNNLDLLLGDLEIFDKNDNVLESLIAMKKCIDFGKDLFQKSSLQARTKFILRLMDTKKNKTLIAYNELFNAIDQFGFEGITRYQAQDLLNFQASHLVSEVLLGKAIEEFVEDFQDSLLRTSVRTYECT